MMKNRLLFLYLLCLMPMVSISAKDKDDNKEVRMSPSNYEKEISKGVTLVDYWAPWCGPCRKLEPILKEVAAETGIKLGKLNVDSYSFFVTKKGVTTIPTLILYKNGTEVKRLVGLYSKEELLEVVKPYL